MKKAIAFIVVTMSLLIVGCATPVIDGYSKPTVATNVVSYLDDFPLGKVTKDSLINNLGIPDKISEFEGKTYYSYDLGHGYGKRQYVYELTDGLVTDVRYHDQGPYNGSSARKRQSK